MPVKRTGIRAVPVMMKRWNRSNSLLLLIVLRIEVRKKSVRRTDFLTEAVSTFAENAFNEINFGKNYRHLN